MNYWVFYMFFCSLARIVCTNNVSNINAKDVYLASRPNEIGSKNGDNFPAHEFTEEEYNEQMMKIGDPRLEKFDKNKDGYLSFAEVGERTIADSASDEKVNQRGQKPVGHDPTKKIMRDFMKINVTGEGLKQKIFGPMDANGDGLVTIKEGLQYIGGKVIGVFKPGNSSPPHLRMMQDSND